MLQSVSDREKKKIVESFISYKQPLTICYIIIVIKNCKIVCGTRTNLLIGW